jgi:hypothetical protein
VEPWLGYARLEVTDEQGLVRKALVRCSALDADGRGPREPGPLEVLAAHDARARAEREHRRTGGEMPVDPWPRVVIDGRRFVSTGLEAARPLAHLAACLRAKGGK